MFSAAVDSNRSAPRPAQSPKLSTPRPATTAGTRADVVADEVRYDARVPRIVLGDALLDLPDEVRPDVCGLGVDAATELGEQRDERRAEAEADDEERRLGDGHFAEERLVGGEDAPDA